MERKKISVVVSVYNEELSLNQFYKTTVSVLQRKMPKLRWWIFRVILDMRQR